MATKVVMEALSPTMEEGRLVAWRKQEGDAVTAGETLAEVETDKAVMELVARADGVLRRQMLAEGATVPVGALVGVIGAADEDIAALVGPSAGLPAAAAGAAAALAAPGGDAGRTARSARTAPAVALDPRRSLRRTALRQRKVRPPSVPGRRSPRRRARCPPPPSAPRRRGRRGR
jgi:pyruvate dehydrogenase E2 component (dihydrolipoamide acetyltransferase)